jgi:hypothetical protein
MQEMSQEFYPCWQAAGRHLNNQVEGGIQFWLRAHSNPPVLEHLSFRLGNQLFFIRVEDVDNKVEGPGTLTGLNYVSEGMQGYACILPMKKASGREWVAAYSGWGLLDAKTRELINPVDKVTDEKIEMTPWELHDLAVQIVRLDLEKDGYQLMSWQSNPDVDPSIWFIGDSGGPEWVIVREGKYLARGDAPPPENLAEIAEYHSRLSKIGHFAPVSIVSSEDSFDPAKAVSVEPLWRGHEACIRFKGLQKVSPVN